MHYILNACGIQYENRAFSIEFFFRRGILRDILLLRGKHGKYTAGQAFIPAGT
jgi:hypothetical protein